LISSNEGLPAAALAAEQIAHALARHPAKITVLVPHYAMSGGTLISLTADEIVMDDNAVLGPVDPQFSQVQKNRPKACCPEAYSRIQKSGARS
jgi:ClpP class serine protease